MSKALLTLAGPTRFEAAIKKSNFIAIADRADSVAEAQTLIDQHRDNAASHNCWAYRVGERYQFSDDGEPGGSAGRPILAAIDGAGLDQLLVLVIRHYGGVKLGVGGLARAYRSTAAQCLQLTERLRIIPTERLSLRLDYADLGRVYALLERLGARSVDQTEDAQQVRLAVEISCDQVARAERLLAEVTRGRASLSRTGEGSPAS